MPGKRHSETQPTPRRKGYNEDRHFEYFEKVSLSANLFKQVAMLSVKHLRYGDNDHWPFEMRAKLDQIKAYKALKRETA